MDDIKKHSSETPTDVPVHQRHSSSQLVSKIPHFLPHERVFPVQIGSELFKLSGASISSDAPSYFSQYFQCQIKAAEESGEDLSTAIRTLYIDRDPVTFKDISLHLQGYHVQPRDGQHYVRLFADAQFYSLPKLVSQLYEEDIFMSIGHREFKIPRDLFTGPGNSPNYFSLGFAVFFSSPEDLFPGLDREGLIRPPSIQPPSVPGRSADVFEEILHLLRGYPVHIRNDAHRQTLLRDVRYFNFKGLEQRLIPHSITYNQSRRREEIVLRLADVMKSGVTVAPEPVASDPNVGWVNYARPFVDTQAYELILEVGGEATKLCLGQETSPTIEFFRDTKVRIARLLGVIASKLSLPPTSQTLDMLGLDSQSADPGDAQLNETAIRVELDPEASIVLDGSRWSPPGHKLIDDGAGATAPPDVNVQFPPFLSDVSSLSRSAVSPTRKKRRLDQQELCESAVDDEWIIRTGQWRLRIQSARDRPAAVECVFVAVKLDAMSSELARNASGEFLAV